MPPKSCPKFFASMITVTFPPQRKVAAFHQKKKKSARHFTYELFRQKQSFEKNRYALMNIPQQT